MVEHQSHDKLCRMMEDLDRQALQYQEKIYLLQVKLHSQRLSEEQRDLDTKKLLKYTADLALTEMIRAMQNQAIPEVSRIISKKF